eukprot:TRINITY_DN2280_c1_g1_i1.p3 TRINITY_DN2280_c1_g1~~TRINITY_DN2280_c1_g1_i1.p3  ORF type:complete len:156 (+),score=33.27 TRINITY_DN2280_c1_g1_i1:238-705(+)
MAATETWVAAAGAAAAVLVALCALVTAFLWRRHQRHERLRVLLSYRRVVPDDHFLPPSPSPPLYPQQCAPFHPAPVYAAPFHPGDPPHATPDGTCSVNVPRTSPPFDPAPPSYGSLDASPRWAAAAAAGQPPDECAPAMPVLFLTPTVEQGYITE